MYSSHHPQQGHGGPPLPPGWIAEWDPQDQRYIFVNQRTGERSWNHPGSGPQGYSSPQGYGQPQGYGPPRGAPAPQQKNHNLAYGAGGLVAGLAGGAFMMHEHDKRMNTMTF